MRRKVDGLLLLDKPAGITSNAALQAVKRLYRAEKAGHAGTLDPLASGLLPVLFGEAAKYAGRLLDADKEYLAIARLGATTATGDAEGEILERRPVSASDAEIARALARFTGRIEQIPPMYSALKRAGRPLYKLARKGVEVERAPREVQIRCLELLRRDGDLLELRIVCSKGTYVRTLAEDIGAALGTGAYLAGLRRTATAGFELEDAATFEALERMTSGARDRRLLAVDRLLEGLPPVLLDAPLAARFRQGQSVRLEDGAQPGEKRVYGPGGSFLGLGALEQAGELRAVRLMASPQASAQAAEKHRKNL